MSYRAAITDHVFGNLDIMRSVLEPLGAKITVALSTDEPTLRQCARDAGSLSGVALDVSEIEPLPVDHPLRTHPRALITPHVAYYSAEAQDELAWRTADEIARARQSELPCRPLNPQVLGAQSND